jgi:hypothetical protein
MRTPDVTAPSMIARSAPSPSSPRASRRARCAALGLDRSARPSKVADRAVDDHQIHPRFGKDANQ